MVVLKFSLVIHRLYEGLPIDDEMVDLCGIQEDMAQLQTQTPTRKRSKFGLEESKDSNTLDCDDDGSNSTSNEDAGSDESVAGSLSTCGIATIGDDTGSEMDEEEIAMEEEAITSSGGGVGARDEKQDLW